MDKEVADLEREKERDLAGIKEPEIVKVNLVIPVPEISDNLVEMVAPIITENNPPEIRINPGGYDVAIDVERVIQLMRLGQLFLQEHPDEHVMELNHVQMQRIAEKLRFVFHDALHEGKGYIWIAE